MRIGCVEAMKLEYDGWVDHRVCALSKNEKYVRIPQKQSLGGLPHLDILQCDSYPKLRMALLVAEVLEALKTVSGAVKVLRRAICVVLNYD